MVDLDTVYVPIGMGSAIAGLITVRDLLGLQTEIVGVVAAGAPAFALAALLQERGQQAGRRVAVILTGGNVDAATVATILSGVTPAA